MLNKSFQFILFNSIYILAILYMMCLWNYCLGISVCITMGTKNVVLKPKDGDFTGVWKRKNTFNAISKCYLSIFQIP